jgi:tetratricopeptide (TPR) repeat protein
MAQIDNPPGQRSLSSRGVGLSRDGISLAWSARRLLAAGKKEAALALFGQALRIASHGTLSRMTPPRFNDDPAARRYLLPGEERAREIVLELVSKSDWTFQEWSQALPHDATILLAAARWLREQGRRGADELLDRVLEETEPALSQNESGGLARAARAEVFAIRSRWNQAEREYRQAIDLIDNDLIRRSWWFNVADIASRLNDEDQRQTALRAATLAGTAGDEITRRATLLQRSAIGRPRLPLGGAKAN